MSNLTLAEGTLFNNRYRIIRCIAMGGMGAVYEAVHLETERRRALKVMHPHLLQSHDLRDRFRQEARVAAHVDSEFIVDVFDAGIDDATQMPFLVMELLRGEELGQLLTRVGRLEAAEAVTYLYHTALALDRTHRAHIVHRDLKPENLFLTEREDGSRRVKVLDFGIAKIVAESATHVNATRSIGTPLYMAPEQFQTGKSVTPATDLYSLGMVAFTLLVGTPYWLEESRAAGSVFAFASSVHNGPEEPASLRARRRGVPIPAGFDAWFARATAARPEQRFPSAVAAILTLADALSVPRPGPAASGDLQTTVLLSTESASGAPSGPSTPFSAQTSPRGARSSKTPVCPTPTEPATALLPETLEAKHPSSPLPPVLATAAPHSVTQGSKPKRTRVAGALAVAVLCLVSLGTGAVFWMSRSAEPALAKQEALMPNVSESLVGTQTPAVNRAAPTPEPAAPKETAANLASSPTNAPKTTAAATSAQLPARPQNPPKQTPVQTSTSLPGAPTPPVIYDRD